MRAYVADGWALGGAALRFVLDGPVLRRYVLWSAAILVVATAAVAVTAVALRRHAGPVSYVLVGLLASYCLSLMITAASVGLAGLVDGCLDSRPVTPRTGWRLIIRRRRSIAGWAVLDVIVGLPNRAVGSWTVDQVGALVLGLGWGLLSFFAIPAIALVGESPRATARRSLALARRHWGDAVYGVVYLWVRAAVVFGLPSAAATVFGVLLIRRDVVFLGGALFAAGAAGLALTCLLAATARGVLTVVLYRYADSGAVHPAFPPELLDRSVRGPSNLIRRATDRLQGERLRRLRRRLLGDLEDML